MSCGDEMFQFRGPIKQQTEVALSGSSFDSRVGLLLNLSQGPGKSLCKLIPGSAS